MAGAAVVKKYMFEEVRGPASFGLNPTSKNLILKWSAQSATARLPTATLPVGTASVLAVSRSGIISVLNPLALCAVSLLTSRDFTG